MRPVTEYQDYRQYMQDFYEERKRSSYFTRGLGSLSTGVGVHFGIEDADVHVFTGYPMKTVRARL